MLVARRRAEAGQALVLLAFLVPLVLVPVAGYAVEATYAANRAALLQWACSRAAEDAAQNIDTSALRASSTLELAAAQAQAVAAAQLRALDPQAVMDTFSAQGTTVAIWAHELVPTTFAVWIPGGSLRVDGSAQARLAAGYSSPSSRLPLPTSSFWLTSSLSSSEESSSRQREGWMKG